MNLFSILGLVIGFTTMLMGVFVLIKAQNRLHYIWVLFCSSVSIWGFGGYGIGIADNEESAIFWWRMAYVGVIFIPFFYTHFILKFLSVKKKFLPTFFYTLATFFLFANLFSDKFINNVRFVFDEFYYISEPTFLYNLFVATFLGLLIFDLFLLRRKQKMSKGVFEKQIKQFILIVIICFGGGSLAYLPVYKINLYPYFNICVSALSVITTYAIFKHSLFDIKIIIQRSVIYSALLGVVIAFYLALVMLIGFIFQLSSDTAIMISSFVTMVLGIYGVPVIEKYFKKITDSIFFKERVDYEKAMYELSKVLNENIELENLLFMSSLKLKEILKLDNVKIYLTKSNLMMDERGRLRKPAYNLSRDYLKIFNNISDIVISIEDLIFKLSEKNDFKYKNSLKKLESVKEENGLNFLVFIKLEDKLLATICLGEKKSGDTYASEDISILKTFSYQAGVAIEKANLYEKMKKYSKNLEEEVDKRTSKIRGLQETQKQMMIEMSHGLQTPLTVIRGELDMIKDSIKDRAGVSRMERSLDKLSRFIYDMLNLAKLENVNRDIKKEKLDLSVLLNELIEYFEVVTEEKGIKIKYEIEKNVSMIGNKERIEEMVTNFVSNSVKYMKKSAKKEIYIKLKKVGLKIELSIKDTGIGMSEDDLKNIFQKFYRASDEYHTKIRGTGLGLAICKQIIEMHEGEVEVKSKTGKGTEFTISFPFKK